MRLHRRSSKADWKKVRPAHRNSWQQLAVWSHGIITPANIISLGGLGLVIWGAFLLFHQEYPLGLIVIIIGRLADIIDGVVAERTKTKGPIGETVDATVDKLAILVLLPAVLHEHLIPFVVLGAVIIQNAINVIAAAVGKIKRIELKPSAYGKIATAMAWLCLIAFAALTAADSNLRLFHGLLVVIAYSSTALFTLFGFLSSRDYIRLTHDALRYSSQHNSLGKWEYIIIVVNPQSSNVHRIEKRGQELRKLFPDKTITLVETTARPSGLVAKLEKELSGRIERSLICIGGGDGTVNAVINALMRLESRIDLAKTPVLPLWGGNANDFAYMLNGLASRNTLRSVLGRGNIVPIYPFEITIRARLHPRTIRYAACYASFGASAYAAAELEKPAREPRTSLKSFLIAAAREVTLAFRAVLEAPGFDAEQDGQRIKIFEQLFSNGSRMAKVDHLPVKLHEKKFYRMVKSEEHLTPWFFLLWHLRGKQYGEVTDKTFRFTTKERTWAQFDGEATVLAKNTVVSIGHAAQPFYAISTKLRPTERRSGRWRWGQKLLWLGGLLLVFHLWLYVTNPYAAWSIVQSPYSTSVVGDQIHITKNYNLQVSSGPIAAALGYYKSGFLIVLNNLSPSRLTDKQTAPQTIDHIHALRFDPSKPYLISGNQFSVLYPRNLGVFYNSLLDPRTARSSADWQHRQQIYLQSALYALDAFSSTDKLTTTIVPLSSRGVLLTEVHPGSVPSDSLYGLLYAFRELSQPSAYPDDRYKIQTVTASTEILQQRRADLQRLLKIYTQAVQDPHTGLVRRHISLSSARDGVIRDSSFYDNVILWKTLQLADELSIQHFDQTYLDQLRGTIISKYWDETAGFFRDEYPAPGTKAQFSADWLIAVPTGFLEPDRAEDQAKLTHIVDYTEQAGLTRPFPISYATTDSHSSAPAAVRWLAPDYGGTAIWSYWGSEYITLLDRLQASTGDSRYGRLAARDLAAYQQRIKRYGGFPETFKPDGTFRQSFFYKSILDTGWVVQFEQATYEHQALSQF